MAFCTKCGTQSEAGTAFCGNCGASVAATATTGMKSPGIQHQELVLRTSRGRGLFIVAVSALFVFFGLCLITYTEFWSHHFPFGLAAHLPEGVAVAATMIIGMISVLLFGLMGVLGARHIAGHVFVRLTPYGFVVSGAFRSAPLIAWSAASEFRVQLVEKYGGQPSVVFDAISGGKLFKVGSAYDGASTFAIPPSTCELSAGSLAQVMNQWRSGRAVPVSGAPGPYTVATATRKGGRLLLHLLIVAGLGVVVIAVIVVLTVRSAGRSPQTASSATVAQPSTEPSANAPAVGKYDHLQFVAGACNASSHTSEGPLGADLAKRHSRFFCDTAVITFYDNHYSHIMIGFLEKKANHPSILAFAGQVENDGITMPVDNVYLEPGKATPVSDGECRFSFEDGHMKNIDCVMKADEDGRRTVAAVEFNAAPGQ